MKRGNVFPWAFMPKSYLVNIGGPNEKTIKSYIIKN
jgi:hypothetical protein